MINPQSAPFHLAALNERLILMDLAAHSNKFKVKSYTSFSGFEHYDAIILSANQQFKLEVKIRNHTSNTFKLWLFEKQKIKADYYLLVLNDLAYIWHVPPLVNKIYKDEMKRAHSVNGDKTKELKRITYINPNESETLPFKLDKDYYHIASRIAFLRLFKEEYEEPKEEPK